MTNPTPPPDSEPLAALGAADLPEAERHVRHLAYIEDTDMRWVRGGGWLNVLMAEYDRRGREVEAAKELRTLLLDYLPTLADRLPEHALGPLYAALFVAPPHPLTEAEIARGQEVYAMLHPEESDDDR